MKKITITLYSPKELWKKFWNRVFWPRRKECAEWMEILQVKLVEAIICNIIIGKYFNSCYIDETTSENLEKDITKAIHEVCSNMKEEISKPL